MNESIIFLEGFKYVEFCFRYSTNFLTTDPHYSFIEIKTRILMYNIISPFYNSLIAKDKSFISIVIIIGFDPIAFMFWAFTKEI